jgi:hypothetical protein
LLQLTPRKSSKDHRARELGYSEGSSAAFLPDDPFFYLVKNRGLLVYSEAEGKTQPL